MMPTLGILSDTHGWLDENLLEVFAEHNVSRIVHAGDVGEYDILERLSEIAPVEAVYGNIDSGKVRDLPETEVFEVRGKKIGILHIAGRPGRPQRPAIKLIKSEDLDVFICGHSHEAVAGRAHGTVWINPGAAGKHGFHTKRYAALLHIDDETSQLNLDRVHLSEMNEDKS